MPALSKAFKEEKIKFKHTLRSIGYFLLWAQWRTKSVSGTGLIRLNLIKFYFDVSLNLGPGFLRAAQSRRPPRLENQCINFLHVVTIIFPF